ncbi:uncharacterized protein BJ212DRAFT_1480754 [Suillus subaureus]|uniref:Uncharacterized protein n=1 Tax=Suillus subaureus TaxID=48587 RepID=A0A9P7EBF4_9AGAM|nr:uncharacterized protein BJ212DRAFT_1480754 [Suillus subaureus]KAG1816304.1 hypothetical protein BJ212DRAFT_1480754 [Suillus subaureus]
MFMHYHGGGVSHKPIFEATKCLLDDHNVLDKLPFIMEKEHEAQDSNSEMESDVEEDLDDNGEGKDKEGEGEGEDDIEGSGDEDGDENEDRGSSKEHDDEDIKGNGTRDPLTTEHLIDDDIVDEMDEFGYTSLDQVVVKDEDDDAPSDDDDLGAEDGKGQDYDEVEGMGFVDL